jgi:hypothetical protein
VDDVVQLPTPGRVPGGEESEAWNNEGSGLGPDSALEVLADEVYQIRECALIVDTEPLGPRIRTVQPEGLSFWGLEVKELGEAQRNDPDLKKVIAVLEGAEPPSQGELSLSSPASKFYWLGRASLSLVKGVLHIKEPESGDLRVVVPREFVPKILSLLHDLPLAGHPGRDRTLEKVKEKFLWFGVRSDVERWVQGCKLCAQNKKGGRLAHGEMRNYHAGAPMQRVHLDFMGPLPRTASGNEVILVMVDQFTKWCEIVPLPSQTAEVTARAAVNEFFSRFGCPFEIFTDQGRNFESQLFRALCDSLQIHKARTTAFRPSGNGQVERFNATIMNAVRCFTGSSQNRWDEFLPQIAGAIRSSVNRATGFTPNFLMLGREVTTPATLMYSVPGNGGDSGEVRDYVSDLIEQMRKAHETARARLGSYQETQKRNYDLRLLERSYQVGDVVYVLNPAVPKGKCRKLCEPWRGPGVVVRVVSPWLYRVKLRSALVTVNHDKLKPCKDRQLPRWVQETLKSDFAEREESAGGAELYCVCKQPYAGRFMIQCDHCEEWYHGECVNITPGEAVGLNRYKCETCKRLGGATSTQG